MAATADSAISKANVILEITKRTLGITSALLVYRILQLLSFPFVVLYFTTRLVTNRAYSSHFAERLGLLPKSFPRTNSGSIWLHAVSVGEVASALSLAHTLRETDPSVPIYLSTSTVSGRKAAKMADGRVDGVFFAPLDFVFCLRRVIRAIRPALLVVLETEIWPNLFSEIHRFGARLAIVNARISSRTAGRYTAARAFFHPFLQLPDAVLAQSRPDGARFLQLGVPEAKLSVIGNLKYDGPLSLPKPGVPTFGASHVWVAGSTVGPNERGSIRRHSVDEDDIVISTFASLATDFPKLLLILAPRQEARFQEVAAKLERSGLPFLRRTRLMGDPSLSLQLPGVLLLDTIGELASSYKSASVVFVGGSIAPRGGHNILEPAAASVPIVVGPNMQNFEAVTAEFLEARALIQIQSERELLGTIRFLLTDQRRARELGRLARQVIDSQRGVTGRVADRLWTLYQSPPIETPPSFFDRLTLGPLAFLWCVGGRWKRRRGERYAASVPPLSVPVISIGGITAGGSGKTPFTSYLAGRLQARGYSPAILTRGYKRRFPAENLVFGPGAQVPSAFTGDEAQIFLRSGVGPIGIGANRYAAASLLLSRFPSTGIFLLDDGFQHARLKRDLDIVLIDGLDPFGGEEVLPLGRLREPLSALARADAFIITRAEDERRFRAIAARLRLYNPSAPTFPTVLIARHWRDYQTGDILPTLSGRRVAAFCGIGNPENFWRTLQSLGVEVVFRWSFADHHHYKPVELQRIAHQARTHGADILVTTEKDRINCPDHWACAIAPLSLAWLEIELELEAEAAFMRFLERRLQNSSVASAS